MADLDPRLTELMQSAVHNQARAREMVAADPSVLDLRTGIGETALHYLAVENYTAAVKLLIELGAAVNVRNEFGNTAIEEAIQVEAYETAAILREAGAH
jgi:ankyrin repeat protein